MVLASVSSVGDCHPVATDNGDCPLQATLQCWPIKLRIRRTSDKPLVSKTTSRSSKYRNLSHTQQVHASDYDLRIGRTLVLRLRIKLDGLLCPVRPSTYRLSQTSARSKLSTILLNPRHVSCHISNKTFEFVLFRFVIGSPGSWL